MARAKKGAKERAATIVFVDESGFSQRPSVRRTWAPKGQTPILRHHFNWKRLHAIGAVVCQPDGAEARLLLHLQTETIKQEAIIAYLQALPLEVPGPLLLLWDGLAAHRSKAVQAHIQEQKEWLTVERLPAYAPELNPVEYLWSVLKGKDVANLCADNLAQIQDKLQTAKERIQQNNIAQGFLKASKLFTDRSNVTTKTESQ